MALKGYGDSFSPQVRLKMSSLSWRWHYSKGHTVSLISKRFLLYEYLQKNQPKLFIKRKRGKKKKYKIRVFFIFCFKLVQSARCIYILIEFFALSPFLKLDALLFSPTKRRAHNEYQHQLNCKMGIWHHSFAGLLLGLYNVNIKLHLARGPN